VEIVRKALGHIPASADQQPRRAEQENMEIVLNGVNAEELHNCRLDALPTL
jgi:hypothetical protein